MDKHLGISINPLIKFLISDLSFIDVDLMRDNKARLGPTRNDKVSKVTVIRFDITLTGANAKSLWSC